MVNLMPRRCMLGRQGRTGPQLLMARTGYACALPTTCQLRVAGFEKPMLLWASAEYVYFWLAIAVGATDGIEKFLPMRFRSLPLGAHRSPPEMRVTLLRPTLTFKHSPLKAKTCHGTLRVVCRSNDQFGFCMFTAFVTNLQVCSLPI